jgi:hypothetical protein
MAVEIYYTNGNVTRIIVNGSTPNPLSLNITEAVSTIRFLEYYTTPSVITIYRTYLPILGFNINNLESNVWLVDLRTTDVVLNTLQLFDLMQDYENPRVLLTKVINGTEQVITGDYADVEGKISAYLMMGGQYNVKVYSDNKPVRVIGKYYADSAGVKYLRLFDVVLTDQSVVPTEVSYSTYLINLSGTPTIYSQFNVLISLIFEIKS